MLTCSFTLPGSASSTIRLLFMGAYRFNNYQSPYEGVRNDLMKTNQEMVRYIDGLSVTQRTSDGYFDGSELLRQWNGIDGNPQRKMDEFLLSKETAQFIAALIEEERNNNLGEISHKIDNQVFKKSKVKEKGKAGRPKEQVWMHPFLFIRFAMWINPRFEVNVIKFVYDEMIQYRNNAGDESKQRELWQLEKKVADLINEGFIKSYESLVDYLRVLYQKKYTPQLFME